MSAMLDVESVETYPFPPKKYWTHEEYYRLHDAGFLPERCELINGEIVLKMSQTPPHIFTLFGIAKWLRKTFGEDYTHTQMPIALANTLRRPSDPEPDAVVVRVPVQSIFPLRVQAEEVVMAVEVSDSTLGYDRTTKAEVYAAGGIPEYWILDINAKRVYIYRSPTTDGYSLIMIANKNDEVSPLARPDAKIRVGDLFPPADTQN